jgi:SAM-dependent methyltransferase
MIETARLINQDRLVTAVVSLLPPDIDGTTLHDVLDIGCGPGVWLLDLVATYPGIRGVAVDISQSMLDIAQLLQKAEKRPFAVHRMDVRNGLAFPSASFGFVQMRLNHSFLLPAMWPPLLQECFRVLRPGGSLSVIDLEAIFTNKPAPDEFFSLMPTMWRQTQRGFSPLGHSMGILAQTKPLLHQAGFVNARLQLHALDVSKGEKHYDLALENLKMIFSGLLTTLTQKGGYTQDYLFRLSEQATTEMQEDDFSWIAMLFSVWCQKREAVKRSK